MPVERGRAVPPTASIVEQTVLVLEAISVRKRLAQCLASSGLGARGERLILIFVVGVWWSPSVALRRENVMFQSI